MIRYQLTVEEVVSGLVKYRPNRRRIVLSVLLILLGFLEAVFGLQNHLRRGFIYIAIGTAFVAFGCMFLLLVPLLYRRAVAKVVRANPIFTVPKEVSFDASGIAFSSSIQNSEQTWRYFKN